MTESTALTMRRTSLPMPVAGSLDTYMQSISQIPVLEPEEEKALAIRLHQDGDLEAAQRLILHNLRFVVHIARGYGGYGLPLADLIQEGNIGLMKAVKRFDPNVGVRLISYAVHWIRAEIHEFILKNWRIVKVATTKAQRKLFFNLRSSKKRLGWMNDAEVKAVAEDLGVKPETVLNMERRLSGNDVAFDTRPGADEDEAYSPQAYLEANIQDPADEAEADQWQTQQQAGLHRGLVALDPRSRDIVESRWLTDDKQGLQELGDKYGVSAERIRQIEQAALKKLRSAMAG